jgi:transposase
MQTKTYTPEFRAEAVKLVLAQGLSLEEAAQRIAMPKGTLANWVSSAKRGNAGTVMPGSRTVPELEAEVARLRKELAETRTVDRLGRTVDFLLTAKQGVSAAKRFFDEAMHHSNVPETVTMNKSGANKTGLD